MRVIGPHEIIFPDEKLCLMPVLNGLSLCLLDFELDTPQKIANKGGIPQAEGRIRSFCLETLQDLTPGF